MVLFDCIFCCCDTSRCFSIILLLLLLLFIFLRFAKCLHVWRSTLLVLLYFLTNVFFFSFFFATLSFASPSAVGRNDSSGPLAHRLFFQRHLHGQQSQPPQFEQPAGEERPRGAGAPGRPTGHGGVLLRSPPVRASPFVNLCALSYARIQCPQVSGRNHVI